MEDKLKKIFCNSKNLPEEGLSDRIWKNVRERNKRIIRARLLSSSVLGIGSVLALVPTIKMLLSDLARSGFYEYFSMAFSENGSLASYWKEFALSVAESLPFISIILSLALIFVFFFSLRSILTQSFQRKTALSV